MTVRTLKRTTARDSATAVVGKAHPHDSAELHVSGEAQYIDDLPEPIGTLHVALGLSTIAHGKITRLNLDAVRAAPGVALVCTADDIPAERDIGPVFPGDPLLAIDGDIHYHGQPIFIVAADDHERARRAAKMAVIDYDKRPPILDVDTARANNAFVTPPTTLRRGDANEALAQSPHRLSGRISVGGQDHLYLEGQIAMAVPEEGGGMRIYSSTQNPTEIQEITAKVLGIHMQDVTVITRRMGGGFGGKETQAAYPACLAAIVAASTGRAAKLRVPRGDNMAMFGKRHDFYCDYDVGFDDDGRITALTMDLLARCGYSPDLSHAIVDRALFHADNAYYLPNVRLTGYPCRTNTVSNTAFRGFGGPQGMAAIEHVIDDIACVLGIDAAIVRQRNFYDDGERNVTPYYQQVTDNIMPSLFDELLTDARYDERRREMRAFNAEQSVLKRGIAITPVKFGISFTTIFLNQAGALIHVYRDGTIVVNHGGTEMGQGLFVKVAQVVAEVFGVPLQLIKSTATDTGKVPNTSATAASSGADMNGMAAQQAAQTIRDRLAEVAAAHWSVNVDDILFADGRVFVDGARAMSFAELVHTAYLQRVSLSSTGYYATPKIYYDRESGRGRPFLYYAYGAAVSEVIVDTLTGEYRVLAVDILHDVGQSLNPAIDLGQVEGGFIQGMGWLTTEELHWNNDGRLTTIGPATYKIPAVSDTPPHFRARLLPKATNSERTIHRSKAVGEPPLMLALSVWLALKDAVAAVGDYKHLVRLDAPATPERVLRAITVIQQAVDGSH